MDRGPLQCRRYLAAMLLNGAQGDAATCTVVVVVLMMVVMRGVYGGLGVDKNGHVDLQADLYILFEHYNCMF